MLEVSHLTKVFETARGPLRILEDVNLSLAAGEGAAITGPSGSGKSTLLYTIGALDPPTSGTVRLDGQDPFALDASDLARFRNARIGFVFQDHCLLPQCTVLENVLLPTLVSSGKGAGDADVMARARALVDQVGLRDRLDHRPGQLSGGERQRVALARALVLDPRLVLCDEPTGNLDGASAAAVGDLLLDLHRRHRNVLVVVTHSEELAARLPARFDLADGRLRRRPGGPEALA